MSSTTVTQSVITAQGLEFSKALSKQLRVLETAYILKTYPTPNAFLDAIANGSYDFASRWIQLIRSNQDHDFREILLPAMRDRLQKWAGKTSIPCKARLAVAVSEAIKKVEGEARKCLSDAYRLDYLPNHDNYIRELEIEAIYDIDPIEILEAEEEAKRLAGWQEQVGCHFDVEEDGQMFFDF